MPRASHSALTAEISRPAISKARVLRFHALSFSYALSAGCSTKTFQSSDSIGAKDVSTGVLREVDGEHRELVRRPASRWRP